MFETVTSNGLGGGGVWLDFFFFEVTVCK